MFTVLTSKLGIDTGSIVRNTQRGAEMAARKLIRSGKVDQAAVFAPSGPDPIKYLGRA